MTALDIAIGQGFLTVNEVNAIKDICRRLPREPIGVNIGAGAGTSTIAVLEEVPDITLYDVDINLDNGAQAIAEHGYKHDARLRRVQGDSGTVGREFTLGVDYLFIDGDHFEPGVRADCEAWLPHMRSGGFVLFHDYWPYPADHALAGVDYWPMVRVVADELMSYAAVVLDSDRLRVYQVP
jgi:predicted O-methyltransferase YrrM